MAKGLPPASPRLRSVLSEHFSLPIRCAPNAPVTLDAAATAMPVGAFGVDTQAVQRSCQAAWHVWAKGLALLKGHAPSAAPPVPLPPSEAMVVDAPPLLGLAALELSEELAELALAAGLPPASPRLRSVLSEHFSLAIRCASAQRPRAKLASSAL